MSITIYKAFIRPYLDYGDVIYDHPVNESFHQHLESIQYNAVIRGAIKGKSSEKLFQENDNPYASQSALNNQIPFFDVKTVFLKHSFFQAVTTEWNNFDISFCSSSSCHIFKNLILKFIRSEPSRISSTQKVEGLKLLTIMTLGLSHLADHKFRHNVQDC